MSQATPDIIRGVLIQFMGGRMLLPNATIAEVLSFSNPDPVEGAPEWLLGRIRWRGWQLPLVAYGRLIGVADEVGTLGSKVVVLKALGGDRKRPYFALLTQGFPRLVTVSAKTLVALDASGAVIAPASPMGEAAGIGAGAPEQAATDLLADAAPGDEAPQVFHDGEQPFEFEDVQDDTADERGDALGLSSAPVATLPFGVLARVRLNDDEAVLPDLLAVERGVSEVLDAAA